LREHNVKPDAPECLKRGYKRLSAGVYSCSENHCHVVAHELLKANGYAATPENVAMLLAVWKEEFAGEVDVIE